MFTLRVIRKGYIYIADDRSIHGGTDLFQRWAFDHLFPQGSVDWVMRDLLFTAVQAHGWGLEISDAALFAQITEVPVRTDLGCDITAAPFKQPVDEDIEIVYAVSNDGGKTGVAWRRDIHEAFEYLDKQNVSGDDYAVVAVRRPKSDHLSEKFPTVNQNKEPKQP